MINETSIPLSRVLQLTINAKIPVDVIKEIQTWNFIIKSPYGHSYYNAPVGWDYKEHDSLRIADHWNFTSKGKKHCETTFHIKDGHWGVGKYNSELNKYEIIKTFKPVEKVLVTDYYFKMLLVEHDRQRALDNLAKQGKEKHIQQCELRFLNRYFKTLEGFDKKTLQEFNKSLAA